LPADDVSAQLTWQLTSAWRWLISDSYVARVYADDANLNSAGGYELIGLSTDYTQSLGTGELRAFARLDNLANRRYAGSVIVNNTSAQYFEAGPGRALLVGLSYQLR
jgi:iron complex outermembrane receptor protein